MCRGLGGERELPRQPALVLDREASTSATSSSLSGPRVMSIERDSSGAMTEKEGFSVVAATRMTRRFSTGEQRVLLGLGEAVDLVEEEHRLAVVQVPLAGGGVHDRADVLDPGGHGAQLDETPLGRRGDQVGEGGLAGARRPQMIADSGPAARRSPR